MATIVEATVQQSTGEIRRWEADFTDDLPTGGSITAGTATHTPPSGSAATPTVTFSGNIVTAVIGPLAVTGIHYLDIQATFSDSEKSEIRTAFTVNYPTTTARAGMASLIAKLRSYTDAGANDYLVGGVPYWSDAQLQDVLDEYRKDIYHDEIGAILEYSGGVPIYQQYHTEYRDLEGGTAFSLRDASGNEAGTALYTVDYARGVVTFASDTGGSIYYVYGRTYDLHAAAADVWQQKAAHFAVSYDIQTDGHRLSRSQLINQCFQMATIHKQQSRGANGVISLYRSDTNV